MLKTKCGFEKTSPTTAKARVVAYGTCEIPWIVLEQEEFKGTHAKRDGIESKICPDEGCVRRSLAYLQECMNCLGQRKMRQ